MQKQSFVTGALILTIAGLLSRILGAMYRIPLSRLIGAEGIGLYEMAYPVYGILLVVSIAGVPVAISKLVAEKMVVGDIKGAKKVFRISLLILLITGLTCSLVLFWIAKPLATYFLGDERVYYSLISIAPAVFFVSIMSAFRGFYQGLQMMTPTAISQVIEQFVRMVTMLVLAYLLLPYGIAYAAAGATFGAVTGSIAGLGMLFFLHWKYRKIVFSFTCHQKAKKEESSWGIAYKIFYFSIPIILGGLAVPLMSIINAVLVPVRLQIAGYTVREATNLYGQLTGMAFTLMNFPTVITTALAASLVPVIAQSFALRQWQTLQFQVHEAIRLTLLIALPAALGLCVLAREICELLFACPSAGIPLQILALGTIFLCLHETVAALLQGAGKTSIPVKNLFIGAGVNIICILIFTIMPSLAIRGVALSTVIGFLIASLLDIIAVERVLGIRLPWIELFLKPFLAAWIMAIFVKRSYLFFFVQNASNLLSTFYAVFLGIFIYLILVIILGGVKRRDLKLLPQTDWLKMIRSWLCCKR